MNLLTVEHLTKSYTERLLFDDADFSIHEGDKIGVIGINGTGKSTFLKILSGLEYPDLGTVTKGNQVHLRYLPQNPVFLENATVLEAVLQDNVTELNRWSVESEAKSILNTLGVPDSEQKVEELSGGQKKRVALANAILTPCEILVLDEPTNHLDNEMATWLEEYLNKLRGAIVMVTHDRYFLDRVSNRIVEIDKGKIYNYPGNYSEFVRLKAAREDIELASARKRKSLLRTELEWLGRGARARSTKQKAHIQRIEVLQTQKGPEEEQSVEMNSISTRLGKKTIEVSGLCKAYGEKKLFEEFNYIFLKGERVGIIGANGCGKSTLLKVISGVELPDAGIVDIGQTVKIGYFSQENEYMDETLRVIDYIKETAEYIQTVDGTVTASQMLERFLFDGTMQWSIIEKLSGGEKRRLYLLKILMSAPNVLLLDEPTNDLDIQTLTILEDYLDGFDGIVITVSHDRYFLDRVVRRIFAFEGERVVRQYEGGFSDYDEKVKDTFSGDKTAALEGKPLDAEEKNAGRTQNRKLKFSFKEQREYDVIDEEVAKLEAHLEVLEGQITAAASDYGKLNRLLQEKEEWEMQLEEKMERWVYLNDLAEQMEKGC
ncbi:MAG: ABC-F family ATP-binding cassette domain-containing protein [Lachnospiraceae bacterium]